MTESEYALLHMWVTKHRGQPKICEECGTIDPNKKYNWANISKEYKKELSDFKRLCIPCHRKMDYKTHCIYGHPFSGKNLVFWGNRRHCRRCRILAQRRLSKRRIDNGIKRKRYNPSLKQRALAGV